MAQEKTAGAVVRRPHKLKPNANTTYPHRYIFFDCETKEQSQPDGSIMHVLRLGWLNYFENNYEQRKIRDNWHLFYTVDEFWCLLEKYGIGKERTLVFSHNSQFDCQAIDFVAQLEQHGYETLKFIADGVRFICQIRKRKHTYLFLDSMNYSQKVSLARIGQSLGIEKIDLNPLEATDEELIPYCKRDVEILRNYILRLFAFFDSNNLGNFAPTAASLAFNAYRHKFMRYNIFIHNNIDAIELERAAYRGGRCECFFIGKLPEGEYYNLDVNSMYPYVMYEFMYPTAFLKLYENPTMDMFKWLLNKFLIIAEMEIEIDEPALGINREKLIFPIGRFKGTFTTPEILYIMEHGKVLAVSKLATYTYAPIFRQYVQYFYDARLKYEAENNKAYSQFTKLAMNSLYGKFGQKSRRLERAAFRPPFAARYYPCLDLTTRKRSIYLQIGSQWFKESSEYEGYNSFVAIPAFVTAYARMYLWALMQGAGCKNVFYCDTDSLFVNGAGYNNLKPWVSPSKDLGKLGVKDKGRKLEIRGPKMYDFNGDLKIKGVKDAKGFDSEFHQQRFVLIRTALRKNLSKGVGVIKVIKHLNYAYTKGNVSSSGVVSPIVLPSC